MAHEDAAAAEPPEQRRVLRTLVGAQVLSGAGLAAGVTVGALLAEDMPGSDSLAGVPAALFTIGSAGAVAVVGRISDLHGRRRGLGLGYATGAAGAALVRSVQSAGPGPPSRSSGNSRSECSTPPKTA